MTSRTFSLLLGMLYFADLLVGSPILFGHSLPPLSCSKRPASRDRSTLNAAQNISDAPIDLGAECSHFVPMGQVANADGQLHTLGLLERLRSEMNLVQGAAYASLYQRVDKLLRELENPNLHDIANMNFRVELWDRHALHIRWIIAASGSVFLARIRSSRSETGLCSCASTRRQNSADSLLS
jgi:hypothetical protein